MTIKTLRKQINMTQKEVADHVGMSLRSYVAYENDKQKQDTIKYNYILNELEKLNYIDESHGLLKFEDIQLTCKDVFKNYDVEYCYLFGSYAKGTANEKSDVDLVISSSVTGIKFFGLVDELRCALKKRVDLLDVQQLVNNRELLEEVLKGGVKIYG